MAQTNPNNGFQLPSPGDDTHPAPPPVTTPGTPPATTPSTMAPPPAPVPHGLSQNEALIGTAALAGLAIALFFVQHGMRTHLIAGKASPAAAGAAAWALFAFLFSLAGAILFGFIGDLWAVLAFSIPVAALVLVTLILFIVFYSAANRHRR